MSYQIDQNKFEEALNKSVSRKKKARLNSLKRIAEKKYPLFYDEFIQTQIDLKPEYYQAIPTEHDKQVINYRLALRNDNKVDINDYIQDEYETSGISHSLNAMRYREMVKKVVSPLWYIIHESSQFNSYRTKPHYRADYWYQISIRNGYTRQELLNTGNKHNHE